MALRIRDDSTSFSVDDDEPKTPCVPLALLWPFRRRPRPDYLEEEDTEEPSPHAYGGLMKDRGNSSVSLTNDSDFMSESFSQHSSMKSGRLGSSRRLSSGVLPRKRECGVFVRYTWTEALFAVLQLNVVLIFVAALLADVAEARFSDVVPPVIHQLVSLFSVLALKPNLENQLQKARAMWDEAGDGTWTRYVSSETLFFTCTTFLVLANSALANMPRYTAWTPTNAINCFTWVAYAVYDKRFEHCGNETCEAEGPVRIGTRVASALIFVVAFFSRRG